MDIRAYNRQAWNRKVEAGSRWTQPVSPADIAAARRGNWQVLLTENIPVPKDWFPPLKGLDVLLPGGGGGQQGPLLAAAGARVTVFDNAPAQLARDRQVAEREGLSNLRTVEGDMADLSAFPDASFDLLLNPVSTVFLPDVRPFWREAWRVLRPGGLLLSGMMNPVFYLFDPFLAEATGQLQIRFSIPYSDVDSLSPAERATLMQDGAPLEFGHSLGDLLGALLETGFLLTAFYEDRMEGHPLSRYHPVYLAVRAVKCPHFAKRC